MKNINIVLLIVKNSFYQNFITFEEKKITTEIFSGIHSMLHFLTEYPDEFNSRELFDKIKWKTFRQPNQIKNIIAITHEKYFLDELNKNENVLVLYFSNARFYGDT